MVISAATSAADLSISVYDTGIGMTSEQLERFRLGELISSQGTEKEAGSGLGIILVKEFLLQLKGELLVESAPGVGTTVTFRVPQA